MIWTPDGVWLQTLGVDGRRRSSYCGRLSLASASAFCGERKLRLHVAAQVDRRPGVVDRACGELERAGR